MAMDAWKCSYEFLLGIEDPMGVTWDGTHDRWRVRVNNGVSRLFQEEHEAHAALQAAIGTPVSAPSGGSCLVHRLRLWQTIYGLSLINL